MSASLIVLIPLMLLGVVGALCFVGCVLNTHGYGPNLSAYESAVFNNKNLIALWPLNDTAESLPTAACINNAQFNGSYPGGPMGPNSFMIQQPGIVFGDVNNGLVPCASFNGGFVTVGFQQALNPAAFTLEAWVKPADAPAGVQRVVVASGKTDQSANPTANAGYALAMASGVWVAEIGTGQTFFTVSSTDPIVPGVITYLAMTFDGTKLSLFVGTVGPAGGGNFAPFSGTPPASFMAEAPATATPLFIAMGRPDMTGGMFPFNGSIQDVALYSPPLSDTDVQNNFNLGNTPPG